MTNLRRVVVISTTCMHTLYVHTSIARAKLKQSKLFERDALTELNDALQNRSCPMK